MKLGSQTASVHNWIMSGNPTPPEVGKGMLELMWTDRRVWEVLYVSDDKKEVVVERYDPTYNELGYVEDLGQPTGDMITLRYRYRAWRARMVDGTWSKMNVVFGSHQGYYDRSF